jgi:hypothetical protein
MFGLVACAADTGPESTPHSGADSPRELEQTGEASEELMASERDKCLANCKATKCDATITSCDRYCDTYCMLQCMPIGC